jgi:thiol:disulfide interchange protein DsbA
MQPYKEVSLQSEDARRALIFFSFTCPICATHHSTLANWGGALPADWRAEFIPVVVPERDSVMGARAFFAVAGADPSKLVDFMRAVYNEIHVKGQRADNPQTWSNAVRAAGVRGFEDAWAKVPQRYVNDAWRKLIAYRVDSTPSIAVGGRFVITPDNTNGDQAMFYQLANGMVSKIIAERG